MSIVPDEYKPLISLNDDNSVTINVGRLLHMDADVGVSVVHTLITSDKNYEWNVSDQQEVMRNGKPTMVPVGDINEASSTQHFIGKGGKIVGNKTANPKIDRSRSMTPDYKGTKAGGRAAYVLHEALEMMIQEETGTPYVTLTNDANGFDQGAHNKTVDMQRELPESDPRRGSSPGGSGGTDGKYKN